MVAVSYTHLDVYKRQVCLLRSSLLAVFTGQNGASFLQAGVFCKYGKADHKPVSYTHLSWSYGFLPSVYKKLYSAVYAGGSAV